MLFDLLLFFICLLFSIVVVAAISDWTDSVPVILLSYLTVFLFMLYPYYRMATLMDWPQISFISGKLALLGTIISILPFYFLFTYLKQEYKDRAYRFRRRSYGHHSA
jgi:hypothetical protein